MLKKLEVLEDKYKELTEKISDPEIINDQKAWQKYMKEHADLEPIVMKYREYTNVLQSIADSKEILQEESDEELSIHTEKDFTFIGLISMVDPPRPESVEAVANAKRAGIRLVMITGDHKITAVAIAKQIAIKHGGTIEIQSEVGKGTEIIFYFPEMDEAYKL